MTNIPATRLPYGSYLYKFGTDRDDSSHLTVPVGFYGINNKQIHKLMYMNDTGESFAVIADYIEANIPVD